MRRQTEGYEARGEHRQTQPRIEPGGAGAGDALRDQLRTMSFDDQVQRLTPAEYDPRQSVSKKEG